MNIADALTEKQKAQAKVGLQPQYDSSKLVELQKNAQKETEFNRYKQDCRKRALELAHLQLSKMNLDFIVDEKQKIIPKEIVDEEIFMTLANKYYQWLISIPE